MHISTKILTRLSLILISFLMISCSQHGCPGGMCAPNHYYSSPKSIFSIGNGGGYKKSHRSSGSRRGMFTRNNYRRPKGIRNIEYNQRWNKTVRTKSYSIESGAFKSKNRGFRSASIESGTFRSKGGKYNSANIEGGVFRSKKGYNKTANIEGGVFRSKGRNYKTANIEGGVFKTGKGQGFNANIEGAVFKSRHSAKRRTAKLQDMITYKEPKNKASNKSKYGLFSPEIEGWEKRNQAIKARKHKPAKEGHGVKKIDN